MLVVDDDEPILRVLSYWVIRLGYSARTADSADAAVVALEHGDIAVALCDIRMPGKDGIWLADQIRERFASVPVVLVADLDEFDTSFTLRPGVVGYVTKPFGQEAISGAIRTALQWRQRTPAEQAGARTPASTSLSAGSRPASPDGPGRTGLRQSALQTPQSAVEAAAVQRKRARLGGRALRSSEPDEIAGYLTAPAERFMPSVTIPTFSTPAPFAASITSTMSP